MLPEERDQTAARVGFPPPHPDANVGCAAAAYPAVAPLPPLTPRAAAALTPIHRRGMPGALIAAFSCEYEYGFELVSAHESSCTFKPVTPKNNQEMQRDANASHSTATRAATTARTFAHTATTLARTAAWEASGATWGEIEEAREMRELAKRSTRRRLPLAAGGFTSTKVVAC